MKPGVSATLKFDAFRFVDESTKTLKFECSVKICPANKACAVIIYIKSFCLTKIIINAFQFSKYLLLIFTYLKYLDCLLIYKIIASALLQRKSLPIITNAFL